MKELPVQINAIQSSTTVDKQSAHSNILQVTANQPDCAGKEVITPNDKVSIASLEIVASVEQ